MLINYRLVDVYMNEDHDIIQVFSHNHLENRKRIIKLSLNEAVHLSKYLTEVL